MAKKKSPSDKLDQLDQDILALKLADNTNALNIKNIMDSLLELKKEIREDLPQKLADLVSQVEYRPVKYIVYSLVGAILSAVLGAIIATVITGHQY